MSYLNVCRDVPLALRVCVKWAARCENMEHRGMSRSSGADQHPTISTWPRTIACVTSVPQVTETHLPHPTAKTFLFAVVSFWERCVASLTGQSVFLKSFYSSSVTTRWVCLSLQWAWLIGASSDFMCCCSLQVELLIDNEAEKDYLYDVLRMYHK